MFLPILLWSFIQLDKCGERCHIRFFFVLIQISLISYTSTDFIFSSFFFCSSKEKFERLGGHLGETVNILLVASLFI